VFPNMGENNQKKESRETLDNHEGSGCIGGGDRGGKAGRCSIGVS